MKLNYKNNCNQIPILTIKCVIKAHDQSWFRVIHITLFCDLKKPLNPQ